MFGTSNQFDVLKKNARFRDAVFHFVPVATRPKSRFLKREKGEKERGREGRREKEERKRFSFVGSFCM